METNNYPMSAADIAKETKSSLRFIYRLIKQGKIPGVIRIGDKYMLSRKNFEAWINGESVPAAK
jgi:excisionase family DNA binding protein